MTPQEIRHYQRNLIEEFLLSLSAIFRGRKVLDFGCGDGRYAYIVTDAGGEWTGYNRAHYPGGPKIDLGPEDPLFNLKWDVILCTQMLQYVTNPKALLEDMRHALSESEGFLVLTYPTNWPEVEPEDLFRFTKTGIEHLLYGWEVRQNVGLGSTAFTDEEQISLGGGVVAKVKR